MSERKGILFAVPGTTCMDAFGTFEQIGAAAARRFPGVEVRWAYTSHPVRRKLVARGLVAESPEEALQAMQAAGVTQTAVVSLHLTDGMEFGELQETVMSFGHQPANKMKVVLGYALMTCESDWLRVLDVLLTDLTTKLGPQDRVILVAHGSQDERARETLQAAAKACCRFDSRLILGMILGKLGCDEVVQECRVANVKKAWLLPCMVVAGYSAKDDIAGADEKSWASALTRAGVEVIPLVRGLGGYSDVVEVWLDQAAGLLAEVGKERA